RGQRLRGAEPAAAALRPGQGRPRGEGGDSLALGANADHYLPESRAGSSYQGTAMSTGLTTSVGAPAKAPPRKGLVPPALKPYLAPILITVILALGEYEYRILESYWHTGLAIVASILLEVVLSRWVTGKWPHLASAYITGISVGILVRSYELWPYIACSLLSISSKYAIRVKGRHLFNPSNLGVSILLWLEVISPLSQQWGNEIWPSAVILCLGSLILFTLGRLHITLTYLLAFTLLSF